MFHVKHIFKNKMFHVKHFKLRGNCMKKLTLNQKEFKRNIKRIKSIINKMKKQGAAFLEEKIESILKQPKRITKERIKELSRVTPEILSYYATYKTPEGTITGTEFRKRSRASADVRRKETRAKKQVEQEVYQDMTTSWKKSGSELSLEDYINSNEELETRLTTRYNLLLDEWIASGMPDTFRKWLKTQKEKYQQEKTSVAEQEEQPQPQPQPQPKPQPPVLVDHIIQNFWREVDNLLYGVKDDLAAHKFNEALDKWVQDTIAKYGRREFAMMLLSAAAHGVKFGYKDVYDDVELDKTLYNFLTYMNASPAVMNAAYNLNGA